MLVLIILFIIGKYFYDLADRFARNRWAYAILGVISYYIGTFLGALFMIFMVELTSPGTSDRLGDLALTLISIPFGVLTAKGVHWYLEKVFENKASIGRIQPDLLDNEFVS